MTYSEQERANTIALPMPGKGAADSPVWKVMFKQKWMQLAEVIDIINLSTTFTNADPSYN